MRIPYKYFSLLLLVSLFVGCSSHDDEGLQTVDMPVRIAIPTGNMVMRAYGDPGTYETFQLPRYIYLFLVTTHTHNGVTTKTVQRPLSHTLSADKWEKKLGAQTAFQVAGTDSLYVYTSDIHVMLPKDRTSGEVYCAVSPVELDISDHGYPQTEEAVKNVTFNFKADASGSYDFLKDIYTSPYNYKIGGKYYGEVTDYATNYPSVDMVLYHVAARLDRDWNVAPAIQPNVRLSGISVSDLKKENCYLFRPMENDGAGANTYTYDLPVNIGNQWYGRHYFYIIPYKNGGEFPIRLQMRKNGSTVNKLQQVNIQIAKTSPVFTPWMYGQIAINNGWTE